jgi:hemoglobin
MTKPKKRDEPDFCTLSLPLQTGLDHRGGVGLEVASLFPPPDTFEALGGRPAIERLVEGLYDRIEADRVLRPAFSRDLMHERGRQKIFFEEWFGGGAGYFNSEWPPGLKEAHSSISISRGMAERWLEHFLASLADVAEDPAFVSQIQPFVTRLALGLVNRSDEPVQGERLRCIGMVSDLDSFLRRFRNGGTQSIVAATPLSKESPKEGARLLLMAAVRGKAEAVQELLRQQADPNIPALLPGNERTTQGLPMLPITPLCGALARRRTTVAELLVEHGAQYDIFTAAFLGDFNGVQELLDRAPELADASDPACDVARITPLLHAVAAGQLEVARLLLQRGATVGRNSVRLIRAAANRGDEALTDLLLEHGADPVPIGVGEWVLFPALAEKLLARGASVNHDPGRWIGWCCTGNSGHKENPALAQALLRCGADVTAWYHGRTALHTAAKAGFVRVVEAILEYGGDVNALSERGLTPLDEVENAARSIDREPVRRLLIAHGARRSQTEPLHP